jgi:purine-nucleoside phosphorylase
MAGVKKMSANSIVRPRPVQNLNTDRVIYFPWDLPSGFIVRSLRERAQSKMSLDFTHLYRFSGHCVVGPALGAPLAVLVLEPLVLGGVKEIVLLGFCGSLSRRFKVGDAVSVSRAVSDEGTSRHYRPRKQTFRPSPRLKNSLESALRARGFDTKTGTIVTTDAPFRETPAWLRKNRKRGAELVDMEVSAVFALAEHYGVRAASVQIVSDELSSGKWKTAFGSDLLKQRARDCLLPFFLGDAFRGNA